MRQCDDDDALVVKDLRVDAEGVGVDIVADVNLRVPPGTALGIVGESGSGKTTVAMALLGFARRGTRIASGSVAIAGTDLLSLDDQTLRKYRGGLLVATMDEGGGLDR